MQSAQDPEEPIHKQGRAKNEQDLCVHPATRTHRYDVLRTKEQQGAVGKGLEPDMAHYSSGCKSTIHIWGTRPSQAHAKRAYQPIGSWTDNLGSWTDDTESFEVASPHCKKVEVFVEHARGGSTKVMVQHASREWLGSGIYRVLLDTNHTYVVIGHGEARHSLL